MLLFATFTAPTERDREWNQKLASAIWQAAVRCSWNLNQLANVLGYPSASNLGKALRNEPGSSLPTISRLARAGRPFWWQFGPLLEQVIAEMSWKELRETVEARADEESFIEKRRA
jgi:hypothetical protein